MQRTIVLKNIVKDLDDYGFETNQYEPCVSNKIVNGYQMTFFWHVDYLKVSHKNEFEITRFATYLKVVYEGLQASCSNVHDYLGVAME